MHEGKLLSNMRAALSSGGLRSVYAGYLSFMVGNIPYDVAELCTYRRAARVARNCCATANAIEASMLCK